MKIIKNILLAIAKILMYWYYVIPFNLTIIAFIGYNLMIYLIYGAIDPKIIKEVLESYNISFFVGFVLPFGIPYILSVVRLFDSSGSTANADILDGTITHRNMMISHKDDKEAYEIFKKTAHLDVMKSEKDSGMFSKAVRGFKADVGNRAPHNIYKDFMDK